MVANILEYVIILVLCAYFYKVAKGHLTLIAEHVSDNFLLLSLLSKAFFWQENRMADD